MIENKRIEDFMELFKLKTIAVFSLTSFEEIIINFNCKSEIQDRTVMNLPFCVHNIPSIFLQNC